MVIWGLKTHWKLTALWGLVGTKVKNRGHPDLRPCALLLSGFSTDIANQSHFFFSFLFFLFSLQHMEFPYQIQATVVTYRAAAAALDAQPPVLGRD